MEIGEAQDTRFQEREWRVQRAGWVALAVFVIGATLGLFGPGPLSLSSVASSEGTLQVQYYRFARLGRDAMVTVTVAPDVVSDGVVDVWWNSPYLDEMKVNGVTPEPDTVTGIDERVRYAFAAQPGDELTITFDLTPDGMWSKRAEIAVGDGTERVTYDQFIYP